MKTALFHRAKLINYCIIQLDFSCGFAQSLWIAGCFNRNSGHFRLCEVVQNARWSRWCKCTAFFACLGNSDVCWDHGNSRDGVLKRWGVKSLHQAMISLDRLCGQMIQERLVCGGFWPVRVLQQMFYETLIRSVCAVFNVLKAMCNSVFVRGQSMSRRYMKRHILHLGGSFLS